jgi:hypothetical protein
MNLREFWAAEAAKLRDTSHLGINYKSPEDPEPPKKGKSLLILETNATNNLSGESFAINLYNAAQKTNGNIIALEYDNVTQFSASIALVTQQYGTINNLLLAGHGTGNSLRPSFRIGQTRYEHIDDVRNSKELAHIGKYIQGRIVLLTCNAAGNGKEGQNLMAALSKVTQKQVFGTTSWVAAFDNSFGTEKEPDGQYLDYLDTKPDYPLTCTNPLTHVYYKTRGHWITSKDGKECKRVYRLRINYYGHILLPTWVGDTLK